MEFEEDAKLHSKDAYFSNGCMGQPEDLTQLDVVRKEREDNYYYSTAEQLELLHYMHKKYIIYN